MKTKLKKCDKCHKNTIVTSIVFKNGKYRNIDHCCNIKCKSYADWMNWKW